MVTSRQNSYMCLDSRSQQCAAGLQAVYRTTIAPKLERVDSRILPGLRQEGANLTFRFPLPLIASPLVQAEERKIDSERGRSGGTVTDDGCGGMCTDWIDRFREPENPEQTS